ncbi:hypothetical protein ACLMJK_007738 [Lecanora helva]
MSGSNIDPNPKVIESIPLAVLKTLPGGPPPPGIQPDFVDPPTRVPLILGVSGTFLFLSLSCFFIRIYTRVAIAKNWRWDDSTPGLGLIKSSLFIQYYLLFRPLRWVRICVWIGATITILFYFPVTITAFVLESPWPGETFLEGELSWHYLEFSKFSIPTGAIGMFVDWYLFILPIPAVLTLQMSTTKKIGILIIFMTGGLAAIASTVGLYYRVILNRHLDDAPWHVSYVLIWTQIEMFTGVAVSSMPTVNQFFSRQDFSPLSWRLSLKSSLTRLLTNSTREKIPEGDYNSTTKGGSKTHTAGNNEGYNMRDLESNGDRNGFGMVARSDDSQIHLTHDISITQEQLDDSMYKPVISSQHRQF